jgi:hypothetical protein
MFPTWESVCASPRPTSKVRSPCPHCRHTPCESLRIVSGQVRMICTLCAHSWTLPERRQIMRASDACKVF